MIAAFMTEDHRDCDEHFGEIESLVDKGNFDEAITLFSQWKKENLSHFNAEENILFPQLEQSFGQRLPPVMVMLSEHMQIKSLIEQMDSALKMKDSAAFLGNADTCMIMIQQHNMKEEQILYPMMDRVLGPISENIIEQLKPLLK